MTPVPAATLDLRESEKECGDSALKLVWQALQKVPAGGILEVRANVAEHVFVVRAWSAKTGRRIVAEQTEGKETTLFVEQKSGV